MSVVTKPIAQTDEMSKEQMIAEAEKEEEARLAKRGSTVDLESCLSEPPPYDEVTAKGSAMWSPRQQRLARRLTTTTALCVLLMLLFTAVVIFIGGAYFLQNAQRRAAYGWCHIPLGEEWDGDFRLQRPDGQVHNQMLQLLNDAVKANDYPLDAINKVDIDDDEEDDDIFDDDDEDEVAKKRPLSDSHFLDEYFEIDLEKKPELEEIDVPDFGGSRRGRFLHDFSKNLTAILDYKGKRCFLMPLDRERVAPPTSLFDMVRRLQKGDYQVDTKRIRETMRVEQPPVPADEDLGKYISDTCAGRPVYRLVKSDGSRFRRSAGSQPVLFREFAGHGIVELEIIE